MTKNRKTPLGIFIESIGLYFSNFDKFVKYMTFPVLGQIGGLLLVFTLSYLYAKYIPETLNFNFLVLLAILVTLPGIAIFMKAFWEYLVAYGAVNSMLENMLKSGRVYDFDAHTELIKRRTLPFIGLWFLFGIFSLLSLIPIFWVPCGILAVFFVLIFQVFTYEPELSPVGCAKKSMLLVHGHFASTFMLIALAGALTYVFVPQIIISICEILKVTDFLSGIVIPFVETLPISELNKFLEHYYMQPINVSEVAMFSVTTIIAQIFIQYTLPLRSILFGMWYRELNGSLPSNEKKKSTRKIRKPSEKLMEESHKKFVSKKLDRNILRRAMEKED